MEWEHTVVVQSSWVEVDELGSLLSRSGSEGWELVSVVYNPEMAMLIYFFKRPARLAGGVPGITALG